jgi:hypothetical protein
MKRVREFDSTAVYISGHNDFKIFVSTAYSSQTESMVFCFKPDYWEELNALQNRLNISTGDLFRLFICSYLFPSGKAAFPLKDLAAVFTERKAYQYNILLTSPVMELLNDAEWHGLSANREVIIRAAHFYYTSGLGEKPPLEDEALHRVDNTTTGWSRLTVMGSIAMKNYYLAEKKRTGKSLAVLISHTLYSFLNDMGRE